MLVNGNVRDLACSKAAGRDRHLGVKSERSRLVVGVGFEPTEGLV